MFGALRRTSGRELVRMCPDRRSGGHDAGALAHARVDGERGIPTRPVKSTSTRPIGMRHVPYRRCKTLGSLPRGVVPGEAATKSVFLYLGSVT